MKKSIYLIVFEILLIIISLYIYILILDKSNPSLFIFLFYLGIFKLAYEQSTQQKLAIETLNIIILKFKYFYYIN